MRKLLFTVIASITALLTFGQTYKVHSVSAGVKVTSSGKTCYASKGMSLKSDDRLDIPVNGKIEVLHTRTNKIFTNTRPGQTTVTRLVLDARGQASDNRATVMGGMRFGKKDKGSVMSRVYVEKGMVRRSLATLDPAAENMELDPRELGRYLAGQISGLAPLVTDSIPLKLTHETTDSCGLRFAIENTLDFPVYLNVIKLKNPDSPQFMISQVGQPAGIYVLLPKQTLAREHFPALDGDECHIMLITDCWFDIDATIDELSGAMADPAGLENTEPLPVFLEIL